MIFAYSGVNVDQQYNYAVFSPKDGLRAISKNNITNTGSHSFNPFY